MNNLFVVDISGLVQERRNFIANALELRLFFALTHRYEVINIMVLCSCWFHQYLQSWLDIHSIEPFLQKYYSYMEQYHKMKLHL